MDLVWYRRYRSSGGDADLRSWEFSTSATDFGEDAPAPARVGKLVADTVGIDLDDSLVAPTNNVVHWLTGIGWGKMAGFAAGMLPLPPMAVGLATGATAWGSSYAVLGALGIYEPISEYDSTTLRKDLTAHLVFGATLGAVLHLAAARQRRR
jgi:hypothetical protein